MMNLAGGIDKASNVLLIIKSIHIVMNGANIYVIIKRLGLWLQRGG